jgi:hypothetical protein
MVKLQGERTVPAGGTIVSLVSFHRSLIVTAIVFCFVYAAWELRAWLGDGSSAAALMAAVFAFLGLALTAYLVRLAAILKLEE